MTIRPTRWGPGRRHWDNRWQGARVDQFGLEILEVREGLVHGVGYDPDVGLGAEEKLTGVERGNETEAKEDLEYAQTIADHAAKLRVALEAQLKTMANDAKETGEPGPGARLFRV